MSRKRRVPASADNQSTATASQPLFLPELDEGLDPSTSAEIPLFLPEEQEEGRPKRKKRRISSKVTQYRTLNELWNPRQVGVIYSLTFETYILTIFENVSPYQQGSSPSPPGPSNPNPQSPSLVKRHKKRNLNSRLRKSSGLCIFALLSTFVDKF